MCNKLSYSVSFVLMLTLILTSAAGAADPDLLGWWPLNEGTGNTVFDLSASGNNGTINNPDGGLGDGGSVWVNDPERGMVASFNGDDSSGAYISTDLIIPFMDLDNDFAWALWVKQQGDGTGVNQTMLGNRYGGTPTPGSGQFIKFTSTRFEYYSGDHNGTIDYEDPTPGQWVHFAVVKDGATLTHYRNGEEAASSTTTATIDPNPFGMGGDSTDATEMWSGYLSDVRLYTRALTPAEVLGVMEGLGEPWPYATSPDPADGALFVETWANMSWRAGGYAVSHDVYLGDNFADVNDATHDSPVFRGNRADTMLIAGFVGFPYPDGLVPGTTYYWRIDEVNNSEPNSPWKGDVWSFSIPPRTAYEPVPADEAEFVLADVTLQWAAGLTAKLHTVYFGDNFDEVDNASGGMGQIQTTFTPGVLESGKTYYWRVDE
ncbi:MAG: LamG domain-containing protein, partial [Phycisphaerales bacterium]